MDTNTLQLNDAQRTQLDGIVQKMTTDGQSPSNIQFVVNDFKGKYGVANANNDINPSTGAHYDNSSQAIKNVVDDITGKKQNQSTGLIPSVIQSTYGSKGIAGVAQLPERVAAAVSEYAPGIGQGQGAKLNTQASDLYNHAADLLTSARQEVDPVKQEQMRATARDLIKNADNLKKSATDIGQLTDTTGGEALGTSLNAGLTVATGGLGSLEKTAGANILGNINPAFQTLSKGTSFISPTARAIYYGGRAVENAALGVGFNTAANLENKKPLLENATSAGILGAAIPLAGTLASEATGAVTSKLAPTAEGLINSLIKPLQKDFSYGKNPARGILNEGIVANDLPSLQTQVNSKLSQVGSEIGKAGEAINKSGASLNLSPALTPIDEAMKAAAKSNNPTLLNSLNNVKIALTHDLTLATDELGNPVINKGNPKNLTGTNYNDAVQFLSDIRDHTRFTGNPSDDKALNMATKQAYGITRDIMNKTADKVSPEVGTQIRNLNERYADLSSARSAIAHRDLVEKRQNIVNLAGKLSIPVAITGALLSGSWSRAAEILAAETLGLVGGKVASSAAVKTRVAQFLNAIAPTERNAILESNNPLKNWYNRVTGKQPAQIQSPKLPLTSSSKGSVDPAVLTTIAGGTALGAGLSKTGQSSSFSQNSDIPKPKQTPNIIEGINIADYATDPNHEAKVQRIYNAIPETNDGASLDTYIEKKFPTSPLTGDMIYKAAKKYEVPVKLLTAIMQQDSGLGTAGLGVRTFNPGNVGNTDSGATTTYSSWQAGVNGVARFLAKYKNK